MGTGARGEAVLTVDGQELPVLFTNRALAQAERQLGKPMLGLLKAVIQDNDLGINDMVQLLTIGLEFGRRDAQAGGKPIAQEDAWRVLDALGFVTVSATVVGAMSAVLTFEAQDP